MSLDFDSAALQVQHEDEEYDQEDYAREQELQQLLTDLPHDMLEDSGDHLSDYSAPDDHEQAQKPWDQDANRWNDHPVAANPQSDYEQGQNLYDERFLYDQGNFQGEMHGNDWSDHHNEDEDKSMYEISGRASEDGSDEAYLGGDRFKAPGHYQQNNIYHLPENFRPYTNGHQQEFSKQHSKTDNFLDAKKENLKLQCGTSETTNNQSVEPYKVVYKPYQNNIQQPVPISPDATRRNDAFEEMQQEFLGTGEDSPDNMQILQLQVLNKAKGRKLEELNNQLEERAQQIRYLSHQLAIVKDEKDGMCLSLQESQKLHQNAKEREIQLEGQIKALETQIQTLTANEEQLIKQSKVAEVAMETMQQQLLELRRSDTLQRAREQHEAIITALKQKHEEQALSLQQKLDARNVAFQEQSELCCHLREHVKQLERTLEESKLEKNEMINRLSRSLEESQNQCANLLQTGLVKETNQLRMQLQQAQSFQQISNEMNKALQEELKELKEEIALYESAAKHGVFLSDPGGELNEDMADSYVNLGIKKKTGLNSAALTKEGDKECPKDEIILQLKIELERLLNSNKTKRNRISQLQNDLDDCQRTVEDLKRQLVKTNVHEPRGRNIENRLDPLQSNAAEEMLRLKKENQDLKQETESHNARIQELIENQEKLKNANQELCSQMRQMVQDSDRDKQEALDRCERTYQQHYENMKKKLCEELEERHSAEKEKLTYDYEMKITQLKATIDELNKEMLSVKECYIAVCTEKDEQETILKAAFEQERQLKEEKLKKQLLEEKEESLNRLRTELEEASRNSMVIAKSQWLKEKESDVKQHVENEVTMVKTVWEREQKEIKDRAIQEVEKEWQRRLEQALEEAKRPAVELKDYCSQTELLTITDESLDQVIAEAVEKQTLLFQEALKEKEKALRECESRHHESIASQVELALTKARVRWLQELTELEEYKAHLKVAKEKWEQEGEISTAKQVSLALSAAEEKWKKEHENSNIARVRTKELEDKIFSLKRELELKKEEIPAIIKAELAKSRTQWNKEKQEELLRMQNQNEKDYHSFLYEHRNKINEVLAKAKEDFAKQKEELLDQKEAELKLYLDRKQQEWAAQEAKRFQNEIRQYEERILVQVELLLDDMHKNLVKCSSEERAQLLKWTATPTIQINFQFKEKLTFCLQKAYRATVSAILEKAKQEWNEKHEVLNYKFKDPGDSCLPSTEGETGDKARPSIYNVGQQVELQRMLRKQTSLQESEMDIDLKCRKRNPSSREDICCEHCHQQLERKEKECQDLKKKLDKACKHLQLAVRAKSEQVQENEKIVEALMEENATMKDKLDDLKSANAPPRSSSEGSVSTPCSCDGKALEEMRSQYIKAVGKIKSDMLRYIHESKERAADIIKAEVLRERQETARKMRKYYLICLQQLLIDDGKHDGPEKKIICAAGKLATMAKILETPERNSSQSKATHSAQSQNSKLPSEVEEPQRSYMQQSWPTLVENQAHVKKPSNPATQKRIPCSLRQQLDAETHLVATSHTQVGGRAFKQLDDVSLGAVSRVAFNDGENADKGQCHAVSAATFQNPSSQVSQAKLQNIHPTSGTGDSSDSGASCIRFKNLSERPVVTELGCTQSFRHQKSTSQKTQVFDFQETPVRDEGCSSDWSLVSETLRMDSNDVSVYPVQKSHSSAPGESYSKEDTSVFCLQPGGHKDKTGVTKSRDMGCCEGHLAMNPSCVPYLNVSKLSPADAYLSGAMCSTAGKSYNLLNSRKQTRDVLAFQQDSGFDSPQINFD